MQPKFTVYRPDTTRWHWYVSGIEGNHQSGNCKTKRECKKVFEEMKEITPDLVFERGIDRYVPVIPKVKPGDTIPCYGCYKDIPAALGYQMLHEHWNAYCEECVNERCNNSSLFNGWPYIENFKKYYQK